ncbi:hypothetical protein B1199_04400 [Pseudoalteromonas ulvae]|uniref:Sel1 repeat family protein n=1 Tax=Pseudoalteromonas ulvae TaxID=107327 RepID=A0A244CV52_PSEDV|nr:hypothetical protein B1199_04400 [Pseudoalteromonas ulvae]
MINATAFFKLKPVSRGWFLCFIFCVLSQIRASDSDYSLAQYHFLQGAMGYAPWLVSQHQVPKKAYQHIALAKVLARHDDQQALYQLAEHYEQVSKPAFSETYYKQLLALPLSPRARRGARQTIAQFYHRQKNWSSLAEFVQADDPAIWSFRSAFELGQDWHQAPSDVQASLRQLIAYPIVHTVSELSMLPDCPITVVPVISDVVSGQHWLRLHNIFITDPQLSQLPVCFTEILYQNKQQLGCENTTEQQAIECQLTGLTQSREWPAGIRNLIVLSDTGKANVNQGILYLNKLSSFEVYKHEWMHLLGLEDEYRLSKQSSQTRCRLVNPLSQLHYQINTVAEGALFPVSTCDESYINAFKAISAATIMEFLDKPLPQAYLDKARSNITDQRGQLEVFSRAMFKRTNDPYWLNYGVALGFQGSYLQYALFLEEKGQIKQAIAYLKLASDWPLAKSTIARLFYQQGDKLQARFWYAQAAKQGDSYGEYFYAKMLANGEGGKMDKAAAQALLQRAASKGNPLAQKSTQIAL